MAPEPIDRTTSRELRALPVGTAEHDADPAIAVGRAPAGSGVVSRFFRADDGAHENPAGAASAREAEAEHSAAARTGAIRTVAGHAVDAGDCTLLLAMLGLDADDGTRPDPVGR
jgi:hypothetical protein